MDTPFTDRSRNLVRFGRHIGHDALDETFMASYAFRDRGSRMSVLKSPGTLPGPDEAYVLIHLNAKTCFEKLLGLQLHYPGQPEAQRKHQQPYNSMNYYRSHVEEWFSHTGAAPLPPVEGRCLIWMRDVDRLAIRYELHNKAPVAVPVAMRWISRPAAGEVKTGPDGWTLNQQEGEDAAPYAVRWSLGCRDRALTFTEEAEALQSEWLAPELEPQSTWSLEFDVTLALGRSTPAIYDPMGERSLPEAIAETEAAYARMPALEGEFQRFEPLLLKARGILRSLQCRDHTAADEPLTTIHAGKTGVAATWWWDTAFTLVGLAAARDAETGLGAMRLLLEGVQAHPEHRPPCTAINGTYDYAYQHPIMAWGAAHYLEASPNHEFLAWAWQPLRDYVTHWLAHFDVRGEGLSIYPRGACCLDDSQRWQAGAPLDYARAPWYSQAWGGMEASEYEHPDTNTYLYLECRALAHFARQLEMPGEARAWDERAQRLAAAINEHLWDEAAGCYGDRHIETGAFAGLANPASFMPAYAGIAPPERAQRMLREVLLDPERFNTTLPFPTADRSHPSFRSGGFLYAPPRFPGSLVQQAYWKGRTWPHVSYWMVGALWQSGLEEEADRAALKILDAMDRSETIHECYDALTGNPVGHAEFMWSAAAVVALATRHYRRGPLGLRGTGQETAEPSCHGTSRAAGAAPG